MVRGPSKLIGSDNWILNLSSKSLTDVEITLLEPGLKFIQVPNRKSLFGAVDNLLLDIEATFDKYIWSKSIFMSRAQDDIMVKLVTDISHQIQKIEVVPPRANLSQRLRTALMSLREDPNIIVAKADKGDAVVVLDSEHYFGLAA